MKLLIGQSTCWGQRGGVMEAHHLAFSFLLGRTLKPKRERRRTRKKSQGAAKMMSTVGTAAAAILQL